MRIVKATIIEFKNGNDIVHLETDLPSAYPDRLKGNLTLAFETEKGKGREYLCEHFVFTLDNIINIVCITETNDE